jgi:carbonic anhydrase
MAMNKTTLSLALAAALSAPIALAADNAPHWAYEGHGGAEHWGDLDKSFASCKLGKEQSPIDISTAAVQKGNLAPIKTSYKASAGTLVNNGHTIQVNLADGGSAATPSGNYKVLQFHFHTPSEEKVNGQAFPMVAHVVHRNDAGQLAVIGVLIKAGAENAALKNIFAALPATGGEQALKAPLDVTSILPASMGFYAFKGSLTTPPCSEGVAWHVLKSPIELSQAQIDAFRKIFPMNARPVQALNGRTVTEAN